jgi:rubredoxin
MEKYTCCICGHVYNPDTGEPHQNIAPGKNFSDLPDDWVCPVCMAEKKLFNRE